MERPIGDVSVSSERTRRSRSGGAEVSESASPTAPPLAFWPQLRVLLGDRTSLVLGLVAASMLTGLTEAVILAAVAQTAAALVNGTDVVYASVGPLHIDASVGRILDATLVVAALRFGLQIPLSLLPARIASMTAAKVQSSLFEAFTVASWAVQAEDREGTLQELLTNQAWHASEGSVAATGGVAAALTLLALVISALALDLVAAAVIVLAALAIFLILRPLNKVSIRTARALSAYGMSVAAGVSEATRLAEETHVFGVTEAQRSRLNGLIEGVRGLSFRWYLLNRLVPNAYQSLIYLIVVAGLAVLHSAHPGQIGSVGAVVLLLVRAGTYGQQLQGAYHGTRHALPFVDRLREAEDRYRASSAPAGTRALSSVRSLRFEDVSMSYVPGRPVLSQLSFEVDRGETVGIIGPSGAGKSTLVQILLRLRVPETGRYLINDVGAEDYADSDWHESFAYVSQEPRLLHASVADNIRFSRALDDEAVRRAARLAHIEDDIVGWTDGYDTIIGPRADGISGGQRQRICMARAVAGSPKVLVLDEPTSALDPRSESLVQQSLQSLSDRMTLFIVAHRMSTLDICDRLMVIVDGRLTAFNTPERVRELSPYYGVASVLSERGAATSPRAGYP